RIAINSLVCEGCGDCGVKSNCVAVLPKETEFGRKREIDQSNCNKDFSCVKGFCPSFVTIKGGGLRKRKGVGKAELLASLPAPVIRGDLAQPWNILITGVGGTGVVTIGALLGMAAHLENKGASVLDQTGLAQKGGAVTTHVRIAATPADIHAVRIAAGEADLVLGCDMVVVNDYWALSKIRADRTEVVINSYQAMPGPFTRMPDMQFPAAGIVDAIRTALGGREPLQVAATEIATALMGDAIATNLFMLGVAWQRGLVPISFDALVRAIELNGAAIEMNKTAFAWGRLAAIDPQAVLEAAGLSEATPTSTVGGTSVPIASTLNDEALSASLDQTIERRIAFLTDYQNRAYAGRYIALVDKVRQTEARKAPGSTALTEAVARYYFKLMAYKDEYEVARLYTSGEFMQRIQKQFEGDYKIHFNLAPPMFSKRDADGHLLKQEFGPWIFTAFKLIKRLKFLRGGAFDVFGKTDERRMERQLITDYAHTVEGLLANLDTGNVVLATEIASVPEHIRGYGHVKEAHFAKAKAREAELLAAWSAAPAA
ncbi:MAG: 2-oxoacid:acceptor oxidoreductase family protein, partial [Arenimonas sp.]|nr:2-oxoacid:acceptor oxidoreductase family protein [Arenimonas sp.]